MKTHLTASAAFMSLLTACSDQGFSVVDNTTKGGDPIVDVFPLRLDFGSLAAGESETQTFTVSNIGYAPLDVEDIVISGSESFTLLAERTSFPLEPDESAEIEVVFSPLGADTQESWATVSSNDALRPEVPVTLLGEGRVPMLLISPDPHDFGTVGTGCPEQVELTLQNIGAEDLVLSGLDYSSTGAGLSADWGDLSLPLSLPPGDYTTLLVDFVPGDANTVVGTLTVDSTDPRGLVSATQQGNGTFTDGREERFTAEVDPPVDLLFAIDRSCSMDDDAEALGANFGAFIAAVEGVTGGWQVGVVTLDEGCFNGGVLDASTADLAATFATAVSTGVDEDIVNDEALLQMADRALQLTGSGDCNEGFLRPGAPLHLIVVSDEPERSTEHASAWTWDYWLSKLQAYLASPEDLVISGVIDTEDCNEGDDGYAEAIAATGGTALSICSSDWASHVAALADIAVTGAWSHVLEATPAVASITVTVDGADWGGDWSYDPATNEVTVDGLSGGEEVVITYQVADEC